jgi:signal transduction histidine kinase
MNSNLAASPNIDILIVDDTPDNIRFLSAMLVEQGYSVRKALNGAMALIAVQTLPPDLILLDITMPSMDGYEVCKKLKENPQTQSIPIIFLSALDDVTDKVKAFQVGAVDYVTKPFHFEEVLARIQTQVTIRSLQYQLQAQNAQLQTALNDLKQTQAQLIQKEKVVGLGQLVAGVAHEINNPISFIGGNLSHANRYIEDLLHLISLYQETYPQPAVAIQEAIANIDLDFLIHDLHKLMGSMRTGVDRICTILLALRIFSRLDESDIKLTNIHEGIDSALLFLEHRLQSEEANPQIKVIKEYGEIPMIACYASQLNQVFFNLLTNAVDALQGQFELVSTLPMNTLIIQREASLTPPNRQSSPPSPIPTAPWIRIQTELTDAEMVVIRIQDNGAGIPEEWRSRIFEPFFTSKPVGKGSGLGLSTSFQIIVNKHNGNLTYHSSPGQGTEFVIELPLHQFQVT